MLGGGGNVICAKFGRARWRNVAGDAPRYAIHREMGWLHDIGEAMGMSCYLHPSTVPMSAW